MSASFIPYNLRQNKAIDRNLFVELLAMVNRHFVIKGYEYIGMGGPFLEDFKVLHSGTGIKKMRSIEIDENTFDRQKFNKPLSCIELLHLSSSEFIHRERFERPTIVWLDFTKPARLGSDLSDVHELGSKLSAGDIIRITLNANPATILGNNCGKPMVLQRRRFAELQERLGNYLPSGSDESMVSFEQYPGLLFRVLEVVLNRSLVSGGNTYFQRLASYVYADGQQMMTYTAILLNRSDSKAFFEQTAIPKWDLGAVRKDRPIKIKVPDLSVKERIFLDSLLPKASARGLQGRLKHLVAGRTSDSEEGLENYVRYYKQFPYYSKISV